MKLEQTQDSTKPVRHYENTQNIFQKAFVAVQCNCALCATDLVLTINRISGDEVREEAFCPQCELRMRSKIHTMQ